MTAPSGIITLITDFGTADSYIGAMKGVVLQRFRNATLVDVAHGIEPFAVLQAAFLLDGAWRAFPPGTVHLVVVDPGVGGARRPVALRVAEHAFVGPDNGVFTFLPDDVVEQVTLTVPEGAAPTFHGRDVFAPAAAQLAQSGSFAGLGVPSRGLERLLATAEKVGEAYRALVLHVDRFGNVITNAPPRALPRLRTVNGQPVRVVRTYADGQPGQLLGLVGSSGRVEVAVREGSAGERLRLRPMDTILLT